MKMEKLKQNNEETKEKHAYRYNTVLFTPYKNSGGIFERPKKSTGIRQARVCINIVYESF